MDDALRGWISGQNPVRASAVLRNDIGSPTFTGLDGMVADNRASLPVFAPPLTQGSADLWLHMIGPVPFPQQNEQSSIVVMLPNSGPDSAAATVQINLPSGVTLADPPPASFDVATGIWTTGTIISGGYASIILSLHFANAGSTQITTEIMTATRPDPDSTPGNGLPEDDLASLSFLVAAANAPPTNIVLSNADVLENRPSGTLVGVISATDPDPGDVITFSFAPGGNPGGLFAIVGNQLRTAAMFDHEAAAARMITLRATDAGGDRLDSAFIIAVGDVSEGLTNGDDSVVGTAGADAIDALYGDDTVSGGDGADTLNGGAGNDQLDGGRGADLMLGGTGDDLYRVDDLGDIALEVPGGGYDRIIAPISYTLGAQVELLTLTGTAGINGWGNALPNRLNGNAGANILDGGEGNDALYGGAGRDLLIGSAGADLLDGGLGADTLRGGVGADRFWFRSAVEANGDVIADFSAAQGDRIDLRSIDANPRDSAEHSFSWIGAANFSSVSGQLRFAGGVLGGDLDGDGSAEFQITLTGVTSLTAASIWL